MRHSHLSKTSGEVGKEPSCSELTPGSIEKASELDYKPPCQRSARSHCRMDDEPTIAMSCMTASTTIVYLYPNRSTTLLERNAPSACPAKGIAFMAALGPTGST